MNITLLKQISLLSVIIGAGVGLLSNLPFIGYMIFTLYFLIFAACLIIYLKKNDILGDLTIKEGAVLGAIIGITSFAGFIVAFLPICIVKGFFVNNFLGTILADGFSNPLMFFTLIFMLVLVALLSGLMNGFSGGVTAYIYQLLAEYTKGQNQSFREQAGFDNNFNKRN